MEQNLPMKQIQMMVSSESPEPRPAPVQIRNANTGKATRILNFTDGDKLKCITPNTEYAVGQEIPLLGYFHLFEKGKGRQVGNYGVGQVNLYAIVPGRVLAYFRYSVQFPGAVIGQEVVFGELPKTVNLICLNDSADDFALIPAACKVIQLVPPEPETKVIKMYQQPGGVGRQLNMFNDQPKTEAA